MRHEQGEIGAHPHRHEEQPEQQSFERLDVGLQLVAEFRIGEQYAREERAERHREAHRLHGQCRPDDDEQCSGSKDFAAAEARHELERRTYQETADDNDERDRCNAFGRDYPATRVAGLFRAEQRQQCDKGNHGDILKEQDREREAPARTAELGALAQPCQHDGRGRHGKSRADHDRRLPGKIQPNRDGGEHDSGHDNLRATQSEHGTAQRPEPGGLQFQPDKEEQQYDADFREVERRVRVGNQAQAPRTDDRARREVAKHRAKLHPPEHRDDDHRRH